MTTPLWLRVRQVSTDDATVVVGRVRAGAIAIGEPVDVVFGRQRATVPVLGLVTPRGGVERAGPDDGEVHVHLPHLERTQVGPGAVLAQPGSVRATGTAELVVQLHGELPLRTEIGAYELRRRLAGRPDAPVLGVVVEEALAAERARPDPDPDRFWAVVLEALAVRAPDLEDEARAVRFDVNALPTAVWLRPLAGHSVYLDFHGTVVRGRAVDRLRVPDHPGDVLRALVALTPPIVFGEEPLPVLGASGAGWAELRVGWAHVRGRIEVDPELATDRAPFVPLADRASFLAGCGLSPGFVEVFLRGSFLSFDAGDVEGAAHAELDWTRWPALADHVWCVLTWGASGAWLVRPGDAGPVFATFGEVDGPVERAVDEEHVFREVVVADVLRELEATGWFDQEPEELLELGREDLVTADGSEPPTPIRTRRLHLAERVQDALRRLDLPYGDQLLDPAWAVDPR
jgi:hypothetical protein